MDWLHGRRIRVPEDLPGVTSIGSELPELREVGMTEAGRRAIWGAVEDLYRSGTQPSIGLTIRRHGQIVIDRTIGHAEGNGPDDGPEVRKLLRHPETPFCIFSASKAVTAMMIHWLDQEGLLHIDDAVAEFIPEFARHGKDRTTIRHLLTHRAGLHVLDGVEAKAELLADWDQVIQLLCDARPAHVPGRQLAYHALTGGFLLGEIARRVTGKDMRQLFREVVGEPLGLGLTNYGIAPHRQAEVCRSYFTGPPLVFPFSAMLRRTLGTSFEGAVDAVNSEPFLTSIIPAGNLVSNGQEITRFFQLLLQDGELDGARIFQPRTIRRALNESSYLESDTNLLGLPIRYGLGLMLGAPRISPYGPNTVRAFGHVGFSDTLIWADPDRRLSVAILTSGKSFNGLHLARFYQILRAISTHATPLQHAA